jgi:hypothetical protein
VTLSLVNVNPVEPREVIVQAGAYAEHQFTTLTQGGKSIPVNGRFITVRLEPGSGDRLEFGMTRYAHPPTARQPWDQGKAD